MIGQKRLNSNRISSPIGVVSKNDAGDRKTPPKADLNRLRLATKHATLIAYTIVSTNLVNVSNNTNANAKLDKKEKIAEARPSAA